MAKDYLAAQYPPPEMPFSHRVTARKERFIKRYGITLIVACAFTIYSVVLSAWVNHRAEKRLTAQYEDYYQQMIDAWIDEQKMEQSRQYFLSGDASREAAINKATGAVAAVISKLETDQQKLTEACCMLARVMNPAYPNSFEEVAEQEKQWMLYDGRDKTYTQHDWDLAESIVRPYMESGIIPNGLTADMVYGEWSVNDFVLRDIWETNGKAHYWRWS